MSTFEDDLLFAKRILEVCKDTANCGLKNDSRFIINEEKYWYDLSFDKLEDNADYDPDSDEDDDSELHYIVSVEFETTDDVYLNGTSQYSEDELIFEYGDVSINIRSLGNGNYFNITVPIVQEYTEEMYFQNSLIYSPEVNRILLVAWYLRKHMHDDIGMVDYSFQHVDECLENIKLYEENV